MMMVQGKRSVTLIVTKEYKADHLKKAVQRAFAGSETVVVIRRPKLKEGDGRNPLNNRQDEPRKRPAGKAILVKGVGGKSYADSFRKLKNSINVEESGVQISGVRETKGGDLLLSLKRGESAEHAEILARQIKDKVVGATVNMLNREDIILRISGRDGVTSEEEVERALSETVGEKEGRSRLLGLRPAYGDNQTATVRMPRAAGEKLLENGRIKIGWISCRVRERVDIMRCFRCWEPGHIASRCKGEDRSSNCLRCGQTGHRAKECGKDPYCPICQRKGHRASSNTCPVTLNEINRRARIGRQRQEQT